MINHKNPFEIIYCEIFISNYNTTSVLRLRLRLSHRLTQRRSSFTTSLLLYLDLIIDKLESLSQRYVVGDGRRRRNTVSDRIVYDCKHLILNFVIGIVEKLVVNKLNQLLLCCLRNIFKFDCA